MTQMTKTKKTTRSLPLKALSQTDLATVHGGGGLTVPLAIAPLSWDQASDNFCPR